MRRESVKNTNENANSDVKNPFFFIIVEVRLTKLDIK